MAQPSQPPKYRIHPEIRCAGWIYFWKEKTCLIIMESNENVNGNTFFGWMGIYARSQKDMGRWKRRQWCIISIRLTNIPNGRGRTGT